ncbi:isoleucine--tRNA ligase [Mesotoga sp. BH458_6_3_2_1]|uniref:isoleucine--tRNA ligase n=5 Tax=unclassified Mesotoga TaxID=1184398 RepID=UPI000EF2064B|nr:isoleucine--tRNA ligase [Mesotoga sp. BH458_6_3_2_1]RLL84836.1 isoleucyl-tRNA synthase [Mesotoga sp. BH458_6_3_2_1]
MPRFEEVDLKRPAAEREEEVLSYWREDDLATRSVTEREGSPEFVFFEGPPTANGMPGIHHVISRTLKDAVCRFKTMQGYQVRRKAGWDTHGLPVEIEVEKQLGFSSKQEIEDFGIEKFNQKCKESVWKYESQWKKMTERIGYWIDMEHPYVTMNNDYIESVWWILKQYFDKGYIYEGHKIMPYCPRCGTPLASHEVAQGYKDETIDSIYAKFRLKGKDNEYFIVWTTTPWTLPSNVALAVNPEFNYVKAEVTLDTGEIEYYYLVKERLGALLGEENNYKIVEELKGKDLVNLEYEQLIPFASVNKKAFFVVYGDFVSLEDGSGIVHMAPAFGEDDNILGKKFDLPLLQLVDKEGKITEEVTPWAGMFVRDADPLITRYLRDNNLLFKKERMTHSYPFCWRCDTPLLYYARKSWYIKTTEYRDKMVEVNNSVNWYPKFVGEGRFGNWLENMVDWALSRDRYWGTPLNVWKCDDCGKLASVGSRKELVERAVEDISEDIELHRPYVDDVHLRCECGGQMTRTPEVIDCWFDSGAMPVAQHHYPFENKESFMGELFPADFICEGIDQTRGWFYSLMSISTFLFGQSPYKNVLVNNLVLDRTGQKMSKSKGNTVDPWEIIDKYGADTLRWYLLAVSPPWVPTKFDEDGVKDTYSKFFGTLNSVFSFFTMYANVDDVDPGEFELPVAEREEVDRWVISRLNTLVREVTDLLSNYDLTKSVRAIQDFVVEEVSNWYVRRTRDRYWTSELDTSKKAAYLTLYEVLLTVAKLMAPIAPFTAEGIFWNLTHGEKESVHLELYPVADESLIEPDLEKRMATVMDVVTLGRACRNKVQIKVRQPLPKILVDGNIRKIVESMRELILEEINVKDIEYIEELGDYVNYEVKPNFRVMGPKFGKELKSIGNALRSMKPSEVVTKVKRDGKIEVEVQGKLFELKEEDLDIRIQELEGFTFEMSNGNFVILDTELTHDLLQEGLAREMVSKIQTMRKEADFEITDRIRVAFSGPDALVNAIESFKDYIKEETLSDTIDFDESLDNGTEWNLNGHNTLIRVKRV